VVYILIYSLNRRHRCPHRPGTTFQFGSNGGPSNPLVSEYNERYKDKDFAKREPLRRARDNLGFGTDRMEDATTSRADFVPQKLERSQAYRNLDNLRPEGDMDMGTIYNNEFDGKQGQRGTPRPTRKDNLGTSSAKFEALPSYKGISLFANIVTIWLNWWRVHHKHLEAKI